MGPQRRSEKSPPAEVSLPVGEMPPAKGEETQVEYRRRPPAGRAGREIHPRRPAPPVPAGTPEPDPDRWAPVDVERRRDDSGD